MVSRTASTNLSEKEGIPIGLFSLLFVGLLLGFHLYLPFRTSFWTFSSLSRVVPLIVSPGVVAPLELASFW